MIYSSRISARLGLFRNGKTLLDGTPIDPVNEIDPEFSTPLLATINWSVAPTDERCIAEGNYRVHVCTNLPSSEHGTFLHHGPFKFSNANLHSLDLKAGYPFRIEQWGFLACGFRVLNANDVELFAVDIAGVEIVGSRTRAVNGSASVFFGPGMFAIRATDDALVEDVVVISVTGDQLFKARRVAEVGPAYEPATNPNPYKNQSYLGQMGLSPLDSLRLRQLADNLARAGTAPPVFSRLDRDVHRRMPSDIWLELDALDLVRQTADHFDDIRDQPFWTFKAPIVGGSDSLEVSAGPMIQLLALAGPVEALSLGQAVTLPVSDFFELTEPVDDAQSAYDLMYKDGRLPFPLFWLSADFFDTALRATVEEFAIAGLDLPIDRRLLTSAQQVAKRRPQILDGPAFSDVKLWLDPNASGTSFFLATGPSDSDIVEDKKRSGLPKNFMVQTPEPDTLNPLGLPSLQFGPFELPFDQDIVQPIVASPRDRFGRWPQTYREDCTLTPWPVGAPGLLSLTINYAADESVAARIAFLWDRTMRRQDNARIGIRFVQATAGDLLPFDTPFEPTAADLTIEFDNSGNPSIDAGHAASGASVRLVKTVEEPVEIGGLPASSVQFYDLVLPLGPAAAVMGNLTRQADRLFSQIVADAAEKVSGTRRTPEKLPRLDHVINDPRPPILQSEPWSITWTSLPNGVTGEARALLQLPSFKDDGPKAVAYYVWRAQETAILHLLLARLAAEGTISDDTAEGLLKVIRRETNMSARLALVQPLIEARLPDPEFEADFTSLFAADEAKYIPAADGHIEVVLPPHQTGFEFILFTGLSKYGVATEKNPAGLMRILAVPDRQLPTRPALRIFTSDDSGLLEASGLCLALVSHARPFTKDDVRFFWEAGGALTDADELLFSIVPISELDHVHVATNYISEIDTLLESGIGHDNRRFFLLRPPARTRAVHNFAVDLRNSSPGSPLDEISSGRSTIQSHLLRE
ncbi:hypothetical protein NKI71_13685 [Mesorhizobium sp. M0510]|uniref:hypothetical protein n=1 Tax=Mesorhizobium sp. M0510 TaxID=2956954 RepID=UPI00333BE552